MRPNKITDVFIDAVQKGECTEHAGRRTKRGYGQFRYDGARHGAHRLAFCATRGLLPEYIAGKVVMHMCDNPACVNPVHLRLGTHKDNMDDKHAKGRQKYVANSLKVTADEEARILDLHSQGLNQREIGEIVERTQSCISITLKRVRGRRAAALGKERSNAPAD